MANTKNTKSKKVNNTNKTRQVKKAENKNKKNTKNANSSKGKTAAVKKDSTKKKTTVKKTSKKVESKKTKKNAKKKSVNKTIIWLVVSCALIAIIFGIAYWGDYNRSDTEIGNYFSSEMSQRDKAIEIALKKLKDIGDNTEINELKTTKKKYKNEYFYVVESKEGNTLEIRVGDYKITTINGEKQ